MNTPEDRKANGTHTLSFPQVEQLLSPSPLCHQEYINQNLTKTDEGSQTGKLLDFSDEQKIAFPQALLLCAEVDDTFGLFKNANQHFQQVGKNRDENGNPLNFSFDSETFDVNNLSGLTCSDTELEDEDEFFTQLKKANADKITKLKKMLLGTEPFPPLPRRPFLPISISPLLSLHETQLPVTAATLDTITISRSSADDLPSHVVTACPILTPPFVDAILIPTHKISSPTSIIPGDKALSSGDTHSSPTNSHTPPSATAAPSKITTTPILKKKPQDEAGKPSLTRSQSCTASSGPRKFIPPIASSSPMPSRDLNRSASVDLSLQSQLQTRFTGRKSVTNVKSSGYGKQTSRIPPPSPKCAQSPIRSRNSFAIGSPIMRQPMGRPLMWNRETPPKSPNINLNSTFNKDKKSRDTTILVASNSSGIPVASNGNDDKPSKLSFHNGNPSGLPVPKPAVPPFKQENLSKMLNKYGFRK